MVKEEGHEGVTHWTTDEDCNKQEQSRADLSQLSLLTEQLEREVEASLGAREGASLYEEAPKEIFDYKNEEEQSTRDSAPSTR